MERAFCFNSGPWRSRIERPLRPLCRPSSTKKVLSEQTDLRRAGQWLALPDDKTQPDLVFQDQSQDHPPGGDACPALPAFAADRRRLAP